MTAIILNHKCQDSERRSLVFQGAFVIESAGRATLALATHAQAMIAHAFEHLDPELAQNEVDVAEFIHRVAMLKTTFTNALRTKELVRDVLREYGCDLDNTYFDVPRLRVVPHSGYLTAGVSYAYKAHRDTWYAGPHSQMNWWMPVYPVTPKRAMSMFPEYWSVPVANTSADFDYDEWCSVGRREAVNQTTVDIRKHPLPLSPVETRSELRISGMPGDMLIFSAGHLHSTAANSSGKTRFSIDFRTVHGDDIETGRGPDNIDCRSTGTTLGDFIRGSDFVTIPPALVAHERQHRHRSVT